MANENMLQTLTVGEAVILYRNLGMAHTYHNGVVYIVADANKQ